MASSPVRSEKPKGWREKAHIPFAAFGIIVSLFIYGLLQERVMASPFGDPPEKFNCSLFLVLSNRILACAIAVIGLVSQGCTNMKPVAPLHYYAAVSASNVTATFCQYEALKYLLFILQTLGKSAKMIPVMVWGSVLSGRRYKAIDYVLAVAVTLGCTIVACFGHHAARNTSMTSGLALTYGGLLMLGYLSFDGFTSTFQEKLFRGYNMSVYNQLLYINFFSCMLAAAALVVLGQARDAIAFMTRHHDAALAVLVLSLSAVAAQLCIYYTIRQMGALVYATVMTTSKATSIIGSWAFFGHSINWKQWVGVAVVVGAGYCKGLSRLSNLAGTPDAKGDKAASPIDSKKWPLLHDLSPEKPHS